MTRYRIEFKAMGAEIRAVKGRARKSMLAAMRKSAVFGEAAIVTTITRTRNAANPSARITASGTYKNSWRSMPTKKGAVLFSTAKHAQWVERGRPAGKRPPFRPIYNWVQQKRIVRTRATTDRGLGRATDRRIAVTQAVRWKIAKYGWKGVWPLKRTMPKIERHALKETRRQMRNYVDGRR